MGQASVRAAVTNTIQGANIPLVGLVYPSRPIVLDEDSFEMNAADVVTLSPGGSGCVVVVNLVGPDKRYRIADTGRNAQYDILVHPIVLELFFASTGGDAIVAQNDYDTIVDALVEEIRTSPTMSAPATVWSAGEYSAGVTHIPSAPFTAADGLTVNIKGQVNFEAWEQIVGNAP